MQRPQSPSRHDARALALAADAGPYRATQRDVALGAVFVICAFTLSALLGPVITG